MSDAKTWPATTNLTSIIDALERLLGQAESGLDTPETKRQILSLISNIENVLRRMIDERQIVKPTGQVVSAVIQAFEPAFQALSTIRYYVKNNMWRDAYECLDRIETEGGEIAPGLRSSILRCESALMLAAQGFKEAALTISSAPIPIPIDLQFGAPAIVIPLYNLLVRERRLQKEEAKARLLPPNYTPEQENEFEVAWALLQSKGYAELEVDRKGRQRLIYVERGA